MRNRCRRVDGEDQAEFGLIQIIWRRNEAEAGIIIDRHERAHRQKGDGENERQRRIAQWPSHAFKMKTRIEAGATREIARGGQQHDEADRGSKTNRADQEQRRPPRQNIPQRIPVSTRPDMPPKAVPPT